MSFLAIHLPSSLFYLLFIYFSAAVSNVRATCPPNANQQAMMCTAKLGIGPTSNGSPSKFISMGDAEKAKHACGNGDLLNAINCIERVKVACQNDNTDGAHFLRNMVDIEKARRSVNYFCVNVGVYVNNAECIAKHHDDTVSCAKEAQTNYLAQAKGTANMDALMRFQCSFYHTAVKCTEKVLKEKCSEEAADITKTVMLGFEPPNCVSINKGVKAERTGSYDVDDSNNGNNKNSSRRLGAQAVFFIISFIVFFLQN